MGLNIKNERTAALIRELAARTGQSMTAAIEDAVLGRIAELDRRRAGGDTVAAERRAAAELLLAELRHSITPCERAELRAAEAEFYDDNGLPR